jgi:hypothetical protein
MPHDMRMTTRARWYLAIAASRHLLVAAFCLAAPQTFASTSFYPLIAVAPLWAWGLIFFVAGSLCAHGAIFRAPHVARVGLMWSASATAVIAAGLLLAWFTGDLSSPTGPIVWTALAAKDFTVCADPLRSPFEEWAQEITKDMPEHRSDDPERH